MAKREKAREGQVLEASPKVVMPDYEMTLTECKLFIENRDKKDKEKLKKAMDGDYLHWSLLEEAARAMKKRSMLLDQIREIAHVISHDRSQDEFSVL